MPTVSARLSLVALSVVVGFVSGCPRKIASPSSGPTSGDTVVPAEPKPKPEPQPPVEVPPAEPDPCSEGGQPWDGKATGCSYEHDGCCYTSAAQACAAAGCADEHCIVMESYPAQISCDG